MCESYGANLVSVYDAQHLTEVMSEDNRDSYYYWVGLNDREEEGNFKWVDGASFTHQIWDDGEPDNMVYKMSNAMLQASLMA